MVSWGRVWTAWVRVWGRVWGRAKPADHLAGSRWVRGSRYVSLDFVQADSRITHITRVAHVTRIWGVRKSKGNTRTARTHPDPWRISAVFSDRIPGPVPDPPGPMAGPTTGPTRLTGVRNWPRIRDGTIAPRQIDARQRVASALEAGGGHASRARS